MGGGGVHIGCLDGGVQMGGGVQTETYFSLGNGEAHVSPSSSSLPV